MSLVVLPPCAGAAVARHPRQRDGAQSRSWQRRCSDWRTTAVAAHRSPASSSTTGLPIFLSLSFERRRRRRRREEIMLVVLNADVYTWHRYCEECVDVVFTHFSRSRLSRVARMYVCVNAQMRRIRAGGTCSERLHCSQLLQGP